MWATPVGVWRGETSTILVWLGLGPWAISAFGPVQRPRPSFLIFILVLFLNSFLIPNFCKNASNQFKPLSKIL
jgi:hypothetical protein